MEIVIDRRFRGPANSANGGYTCGLVAALAGEPAEVTLRVPPPLERPLRFAGGKLFDGEVVVAEVRPARVELEPPEPVSFEEAQRAARPDLHSPFPECVVCGHARDDGLRIFAGPVPDRDLVAAPWVPDESQAERVFAWAALDCPGAYAVDMPGRGTLVLGRLAADVHRVPRAGERCVVVGWPLGSEGRKHDAGTALFGGNGEVLGIARATWIEPR